METNSIILQGGGEHARVVLDCLLAQKANVVALFDPAYSGKLFEVPQRGSYDPDFMPRAKAIIAIGDNRVRQTVAARTRHEFTNATHPSAIVSPFATIAEGSMVLQGAIIQAQALIGGHCIVNTRASVDHDCTVGDFVHLAPGVVLCGNVMVGTGAFIGAGTVVIPRIKIGAWAVVGAGSVVISDIPDYAVAVGNPAKVIKYLTP